MKIKELLLQLVFPRVCPVCKEILPWGMDTDYEQARHDPFICRSCLKKVRQVPGPRCLKCSKPIESEEDEYCSDCAGRVNHFEEGRALWVHDGYAKRIIYDLKFLGMRDNADFIGYEMARQLGPWVIRHAAEVLVPVPLHRKKLRSRGFNQAELIAERMAKWMKIMYGRAPDVDTKILARTKKTKPQKDLDPRYRYNNIRGAFEASERAAGRCICLVDDIYTTGSTINEAAKSLKKAGAKKVIFVTADIGV